MTIKTKLKGPMRWRNQGVLERKFAIKACNILIDRIWKRYQGEDLTKAFISAKQLSFDYFLNIGEYFLTDQSYKAMLKECQELVVKYAFLSAREQVLNEQSSLKRVTSAMFVDSFDAIEEALGGVR